MINIQPHLDKLDALLEYMKLKIDGRGEVLSIDINAIPSNKNPKEIMRIFDKLGYMILCTGQPSSSYKQVSFEEWFQLRTNAWDSTT